MKQMLTLLTLSQALFAKWAGGENFGGAMLTPMAKRGQCADEPEGGGR